jgi:hypothetical protein
MAMTPNLLQHWRNRTGHSESFMETDINPHHFTLENFVYRNIILDNLIILSFVFSGLYLTPVALCFGAPLLYKDGVGQYTDDNQLLKEFVCKYDCIKQLKISDKTLAKALDKNVMYNNHYFRTIGSKLMCCA